MEQPDPSVNISMLEKGMGNLTNFTLMGINKYRPTLNVYDDLVRCSNEINAWKPYACFPILDLTDNEQHVIDDIIGLELQFEGTHDRSDIADPERNIDPLNLTFQSYYATIYSLLSLIGTNIYLLRIENGPQLKSRIRSYKGFLTKDIKSKTKYIEVEISLNSKYSIMASIIELEERNYNIIETEWGIYNTCMLFSTGREYFSAPFLNGIPHRFMNGHEMYYLNFLKLITIFCPRGDIIALMGGDGGDQEITFQLFCKKEIKDDLISKTGYPR
jgi:hypothetical protein